MATYKNIQTNRGLIKMIVIFIVILFVMAYLGLNIRSIIDSKTFQDNWTFIREGSVTIWNGYLKAPISYVWNVIFIPYIWTPIFNNLTHGQR